MSKAAPGFFRTYLPLLAGVLACSTSAIFIRASHTQPVVLAAMRLLVAVTLLLPLLRRELIRAGPAFTRVHWARTRLPALVLGLHLTTWSIGARLAPVAQSSLIVNLVPVAVPFFLLWLASERINAVEVAGTALAIAGLAVLSVRDALTGGNHLWGDLVCLLSMLLFAGYLALGRRNRDFPSVWLYVIPVYGQAALVCMVLAIPWLSGFEAGSAREWGLILGLALVPTMAGHSLLNASMRRLRGQIVSLCNVSQFAFAAVMGFLLFHEVPSGAFYPACALTVAGVVTAVLGSPPEPRAAPEPAPPRT